MLEKLGEIDTTAIVELVEIKAEQELLESRLEAMAEKKGSVSEEVFERVRGDYEARLESLDRKARPLKEQARREYARLSELQEQCEQGLRAARMDTEELQFRHDLGEFEEKQFQQQLEASGKQEEERGKELAAAESLTERFVEAFRSRDELEEPTAEAVVAPEPPTVQPEALEAEPATATVLQPRPPVAPFSAAPDDLSVATASQDPEAETPEPVSPAPPDEPEVVMNTDSTMPAVPLPASLRRSRPRPAAAPVPDDKTIVRSGARLELRASDGSVQEFKLGLASTTIGRSPDCVIRVQSDSASRRHAEVFLDARGYVVRDSGSNNGTFVNEEQVTESKLSDGDQIRIGEVSLVFWEG